MKKLEGYAPGPWSYEHGVGNTERLAADKCGGIIAKGAGWWIAEICGDVPQAQANAALIAQAPTLLEQRDKLVKVLERAKRLTGDMDNAIQSYCPFCAYGELGTHSTSCELVQWRIEAERVLAEVEHE